MLAPPDASTTAAALRMRKLQWCHVDFQNDHTEEYCQQAAPVPERLQAVL